MTKHKFTTEFEINASRKMLFPYLNTASGLAQWFADDVTIGPNKVWNFVWDNENHKARLSSQRLNTSVRFTFDEEELEEGEENEHAAYIEFKLEQNELTQAVFLKIIDYSDIADDQELQDLWINLVETLKEIVGG